VLVRRTEAVGAKEILRGQEILTGIRHALQQTRLAAERFWSNSYIQHSAHIAPGRDGLFKLVKSMPPTLKYEPGVIAADGDVVTVHGRFSGFGAPMNWIAADILRIEAGVLVEHLDHIQDEATQERSKSGRPMFGDLFPDAQVSTGQNFSEEPYLVHNNGLLAWSAGGYTKRIERPQNTEVIVLTPKSTVATIRAGYAPEIHASANQWGGP
jgi:predicted SnoaL-like aldol condensation-catalyzing enzyme